MALRKREILEAAREVSCRSAIDISQRPFYENCFFSYFRESFKIDCFGFYADHVTRLFLAFSSNRRRCSVVCNSRSKETESVSDTVDAGLPVGVYAGHRFLLEKNLAFPCIREYLFQHGEESRRELRSQC